MTPIALAFIRHGDLLMVLGSPSGTLHDLRAMGTFRPDWKGIDDAARSISASCQLADQSGEMTADVLRTIRRQGAWLFDELLPFEAKAWLRRPSGATLTLSLDPELLHIPFELLHNGETFLAEQWAMGRVVQTDVDPSLRRKTKAGEKLSIHIVADPDGTLDEAYVEGDTLIRRMARSSRVAASMRAGDVDPGHLRHHLRDMDILHLAGHVDREGYRMADGHFGAEAVRRLSGTPDLPLMVFANGCGSVRTDGDPLLLAWVRAGVRHIIGPLHALPDRLGLLFADAFYRELMAGRPIGDAMLRARQSVARQVGNGTIPWAAYVLYGDPATIYFPVLARPEPAAPTVEPATRLAPAASFPTPEVVRSAPVETVLPSARPWYSDPALLLLLLVAVSTAFFCAGLLFNDDSDDFSSFPVLGNESGQ